MARGDGPGLSTMTSWPGRLALLAAVMLVAVACGPAASPSSSAGPGASSSAEASVTPGSSGEAGTPAPSGSAGESIAPTSPPSLAIQVNIAVRVAVSALNVRQSPTTSAKKVGTMAEGDVAVLLGYGGIKADGYTWYQAGRIKGLHGPLPPLPTYPTAGGTWTNLIGWIAVAKGTTKYVTPLAPRCSTSTDLTTLSAMLLGEQLACFGDTPLVFDGVWGCGGCGGAFPGTFKPDWLATPLSGFISVNPEVSGGPLQLYFPPDVAQPAVGTIIRVHAHLDDPRSSTCKVSTVVGENFNSPPVALSAKDAATYCRQHLVVDSYEILGVDPSFPLG